MDTNNKQSKKINSITCTIIFDGSALNRDEKIGNSILSIKKLTYHGDIRPYISKNAIRHYLFNTLNRYYSWGKTPIIAQGSGDKQTLQLDLSKADIISFEELAVFGYMFTKSGGSALTRKSPLGITKAIALSSYNQDLSFYANHDFVNRVRENGKNANPNPVNKEEHTGLFKLTFTLDAELIGRDSWVVDEYSFDKDVLNIKIADPQKFILGSVDKNLDDDGNENGYQIVQGDKKYLLNVTGLKVELPKEIISYSSKDKILTIKPELAFDKKEKMDKKGKKTFSTEYKFRIADSIEDEDNKTYSFECTYEPVYDEEKKSITLLSGFEKRIEKVSCEDGYDKKRLTNTFLVNDGEFQSKIKITSFNENSPSKGPFKVEFFLSEKKKKEIMRQLLFVIRNGLIAQSSNELNTIKPLFILAADVKVPMPVFHGDIDVQKEEGKLKVVGINDALDNGWLNGNIFLHTSERLITPPVSDLRINRNWDVFLKAVLPENENNESTQN